jgi:hypothetical protein
VGGVPPCFAKKRLQDIENKEKEGDQEQETTKERRAIRDAGVMEPWAAWGTSAGGGLQTGVQWCPRVEAGEDLSGWPFSWFILLVGYKYFNDKKVQLQNLYFADRFSVDSNAEKNRIRRQPLAKNAKGRPPEFVCGVQECATLLVT